MNVAGVYGQSVFSFPSTSVPASAKALPECCKLTDSLITLPDPGMCPTAWGQVKNDESFVVNENETRVLSCASSTECEYRICFNGQLDVFQANAQSYSYYPLCCFRGKVADFSGTCKVGSQTISFDSNNRKLLNCMKKTCMDKGID